MGNKSYVGVDSIYYALVTQDDASAYAAGTPVYLAPAMNVSAQPTVNSKTQYADNGPFDVAVGEGETKVSCEITGISAQLLATILGMTYDVTNARVFDNGGTPPYVALGFRGKKSDGSYRYFWFLKGLFTKPKDEMATQADTPDFKSITLEFTAIKTIYEFELVDSGLTDGVKRNFGDDDDTNFSETGWFTSVQVPSAGTPAAFTCTPSPADAATGVAVASNITLTFSNPLAANAENGIILTSVAGVVKACARTINAARTVVTLDPTTNLSGTTQYLVIVPGVTDVYGQSLADAVYDFTTT